MGEHGLQFVTSQYDLSDYIAGLEKMFERVISGTRHPVST